jgi:MFS family permease
MLIPAGQMILARAAGPARMGRVMSTVGVAVVLAPVVGPVVGGLLIAESWRWLFLVNVPLGLAGLVAGIALIPRAPGSREAGRLDVAGLVLTGAGLPLLTYGITLASRRASLASTGVLVGLLGGAAALAAFGVWSMKTPRPLLNLRLWGNRAFCAALGTGFFGGAALFGALVLVPLYFEVQRGQSTVHTGLLLIGQGIGAAVTMPISGRLTDRVGGGVVSIAGFLIMLAASLPMEALGAHASYVAVEALFTALGLGTGLAIMPSVSAAYSAVEPAQIPDATPQLNGLQRVGGSIGAAVLVVLVDRSLASGRSPAAAFHTGFLALSAVIVLALVPSALLTAVLRRRPQP